MHRKYSLSAGNLRKKAFLWLSQKKIHFQKEMFVLNKSAILSNLYYRKQH